MIPPKDKLFEILSRLSSRADGAREKRACPDEERLADYLCGFLSIEQSADLENHLSGCTDCMDDLAAAYSSGVSTEIEQVPAFLLERVAALVPGKKPAFDIIASLSKDALKLIRASVSVTWPTAAAAVRGDQSPSPGKILQFNKLMGRFNITVELEGVEGGLCHLDIRVKDSIGRPAEGVRLSLLSGGREQASFLTPAEGEILFERISPADYQLAVSDGGGLVGAIELSLTREL